MRMRRLMRVLLDILHDVKVADSTMVVVVIVLRERHIISMRVVIMAQLHSRQKRMRLRDFIDGFKIVALVGKREKLPCTVRTLCRDGHRRGGPTVATFRANSPAGWHSILVHFQHHHTMAGIDASDFLAVLVMPTRTRFKCAAVLVTPGTRDHPNGYADNQHC